jgi:hypothetical protein
LGRRAGGRLIGATGFATSLFPRDGRYLLPVKRVVQTAEAIGLGDWSN